MSNSQIAPYGLFNYRLAYAFQRSDALLQRRDSLFQRQLLRGLRRCFCQEFRHHVTALASIPYLGPLVPSTENLDQASDRHLLHKGGGGISADAQVYSLSAVSGHIGSPCTHGFFTSFLFCYVFQPAPVCPFAQLRVGGNTTDSRRGVNDPEGIYRTHQADVLKISLTVIELCWGLGVPFENGHAGAKLGHACQLALFRAVFPVDGVASVIDAGTLILESLHEKPGAVNAPGVIGAWTNIGPTQACRTSRRTYAATPTAACRRRLVCTRRLCST